MKKIINLKLVIVSEYQNTKTYLLKDILKTDRKKFLSLAKLKTQFHGLSFSYLVSSSDFSDLCY